MSGARRRHHFGETAKPASVGAVLIGILSLAVLGGYAYILWLSAQSAGDMDSFTGGICLLLLLLSIGLLSESIRLLRNNVYSMLSRIAGFLPALLAVLIWTGTFLLGLFAR